MSGNHSVTLMYPTLVSNLEDELMMIWKMTLHPGAKDKIWNIIRTTASFCLEHCFVFLNVWFMCKMTVLVLPTISTEYAFKKQ